MRKRERFGTYDKSFEDELDMVPLEEGITHLYNTRGIVDKWLGHPTLDSIFPGFASYHQDLGFKGQKKESFCLRIADFTSISYIQKVLSLRFNSQGFRKHIEQYHRQSPPP